MADSGTDDVRGGGGAAGAAARTGALSKAVGVGASGKASLGTSGWTCSGFLGESAETTRTSSTSITEATTAADFANVRASGMGGRFTILLRSERLHRPRDGADVDSAKLHAPLRGTSPVPYRRTMGRELANRAAMAIAPGVLLSGFAGGVAFPILPLVGERAGLSLAFIGAILAANRAARVVCNPFIGAVTDRLGGRRTLIAGLLLQVVVMALYVLGVQTGRPGAFFLAGRLLHGPGSACVFVAGQALALEAGGKEHGGRTAGIVRAALAIGVPFGIVAGGLLSERIGDAGTFELAMGALVAAAAAAYLGVPDLRADMRRAPPFLVTVRGFANRTLAAIGALNFAATFSASGMVLTTLVLLVHARHLSVFHLGDRGTSGALMGWLLVTESITMPFAGSLGDRFRIHARIATSGLLVLVVGLAVVAMWQTSIGLGCGLALIGIGGGALGPSLLTLLGQHVRGDERGVAVGMLQLCGDVGGAMGPLVGTALLASNLTTPYLVSAALMLLVVPLAIRLARNERREQSACAM